MLAAIEEGEKARVAKEGRLREEFKELMNTPRRAEELLRRGADPNESPAIGVPSPAERAFALHPPNEACGVILSAANR